MDPNRINRKSWADACRVLAMFGVVLIHSCGLAFYSFGKIPNSYWFSANFIDSFVRAAIPLFVMLSGSLLLKSTDALSLSLMIVVKRVGRVLLPLIAWSMFYLWWVDYNTPDKVLSLAEWVEKFAHKPVMYHLWFGYMIIGLYILLPVLQVIFRACEKNTFFKWYFLSVWFVINCLSIYIPIPFIESLQVTMLIGYGGYFIIGGLLSSTSFDNIRAYKWLVLYLTGVCVTCLITWVRSSSSGLPDELAYLYFTPNVFLASIGAFMLIRKVRIANPLALLAIRRMSDACFFIYFVHVIVLELIYGTLGLQVSTSNIHPALSIPIVGFLTFIVSFACAELVRLIPGSRRILG